MTDAAQKIKVACVQMTSVGDINANIAELSRLIREAAAEGAKFIATPEYTGVYGTDGEIFGQERAYFQKDHPVLQAVQSLAKEWQVEILLGSIAVKAETAPGKFHNRSILVGPDGEVKATYNKIHLFNINSPGFMVYEEGDMLVAGREAVLADSSAFPGRKFGMTVCYDVRNPGLYRDLAQAGAGIITVPAAFTQKTGDLGHWHKLLQARAIETCSFIVAPNQTGQHSEARKTYGHSMIVDPWGNVLKEAGQEVGVIVAEIDPQLIDQARTKIPAWNLKPQYRAPGEGVGTPGGGR